MAYFSNGTEGMILDAQCIDCIHADPNACCPIASIHWTYNYTQCDEGQANLKDAMNTLVSEDGTCNMKRLIDAVIRKTVPTREQELDDKIKLAAWIRSCEGE